MVDQRINLNTATVEELRQLPGIGSVLAQRVISYRETVHPFEEPAEIMAVSGIGEGGYRAIADRLTVVPAAEGSLSASDAPLPEEEEEGVMLAGPAVEEDSDDEAEVAPSEEELEIEAVPPGESFADEPVELGEEVVEETGAEEGPEETVSAPDELAVEATEETTLEMEKAATQDAILPEDAGEPPEEDTAEEVSAEEEPAEEELPEAEPAEEGLPDEEPAEEELAGEEEAPEGALPPSSFAPAPEPTPSPGWWRRLSWLWTALLGGLLGMVFALIVWAGINGSLDVGHSRSVVGVEGRLNSLVADVGTLETNVEGLQMRLDALEKLTDRMEAVEGSVDDLRHETSALNERADALEQEIIGVSEELQAVSDNVEAVQDQAERADSFFNGLQVLLMDIFGEVEGISAPTPTPTPEGK